MSSGVAGPQLRCQALDANQLETWSTEGERPVTEQILIVMGVPK